ncbi:MAG: Asp23/Gls24 family envelope stress response protein [Oscillospiraceae bacterium]|nr:Asp23/Gls24 family envelope stress response protein [Oscillospiraceae bacterium]
MVNLVNENGTISITNEVFTNLAGDAATKCFGVKGMAGRSKEGGPLQLLRRESMSKGVEVRFNDDDSISLDLHIGVDQGVNISAVARSIMNEVSYKLSKATGMPVKSVDVYIDTII